MAARLRKKSRSANYAISVDPLELKRNSPCFIGKLRCVLCIVVKCHSSYGSWMEGKTLRLNNDVMITISTANTECICM